MPMINGRFYINPRYGQALESNRIMDAIGNTQPDDDDDDEGPALPAVGNFLPNLLNVLIGMFTQPVSVSDYFKAPQQPYSPTPQLSQNPYGDKPYLAPYIVTPGTQPTTPGDLIFRRNQYGQYPIRYQLANLSDATAQPDPSQSATPQAPDIQLPAPQVTPSNSDSNNPFGDFGGAQQNGPPPPSPYDNAKVRDLTVQQIANIVANENRDVTPGTSSPEDLQDAKIAQAHAIINADLAYGPYRMQYVHTAPDDVSATLQNSPQYQQALDVARTAFEEQASGYDRVAGSMFFNNRNDSSSGPRTLGSEQIGVTGQYGPFQYGNETVYTNIYENPKSGPKSR